ncbi:MAG: Tex-like N-terminal domain-containing protein [Planctomycetota bacterium]
MASQSILARLQAEFDSPAEHIAAVVAHLEQGAPPQFVTRFRRDETGDLGEERVIAIAERLQSLRELEERKAAILEQAEQQGKLTDELRDNLTRSSDQDYVDDVYQSFRPRRRTVAVQAEEKGVGPLALAVHHRQLGDASPLQAAEPYVDAGKDMPTPESVLEQVVLILAERYGSDPEIRARVRSELARGILRAEVLAPSKKGAQRYQNLFDLNEPVRRIPPARMLALRRAEWEGILRLRLHLPEGRARAMLRERFAADVDASTPLGEFLDLVFDHTYQNHLWPACEADVRRRLKERADRETVRTLARGYRSQLLAPPLGAKKAIGVRASGKALWIVALNEDGSIAGNITVQADDEAHVAEAIDVLAKNIAEHGTAAVAIPHGRRQERTQRLVEQAVGKVEPGKRPMLVPVDEGASAIWATSAVGRKAMPDADVGVRTATSLARRMQDPMAELLGMDLRTLGFGQSFDDVHQRLLHKAMDNVVASAVARVGVDVNVADSHQLARVPGIGRDLADKIVAYRKEHGPFRTRAALAEVPGIDATRYAHLAGFVRVFGGDNPLDATELHPEQYELAEKIAAKENKPVGELLGRDLSWLPIREWLESGIQKRTLREVIDAMASVGKDPRGELSASATSRVHTMADLTVGMELEGRITNLTEFGAFVDIGVGQDGLIHISQIPRERLQDADNMLCVGEVLRCFVARLDPERHRISLSLHKPSPESEQRDGPPRRDRRPHRRDEGRGPGRDDRRGPRPPRGPRERGDRDDRQRREGVRRPFGPPRVITIESEKQREEALGHKGELRSLAGLRSLLSPKPDTPPTDAPAS